MDYSVLLNPFFLTYLIGSIAMFIVGVVGISLRLSLASKGLRKYKRKIRFFYLFAPARWERDIDPSDLPVFRKSRKVDLYTLSSLLVIWLVQAALGHFFLCQELNLIDGLELLRQQPESLGTLEKTMVNVCQYMGSS